MKDFNRRARNMGRSFPALGQLRNNVTSGSRYCALRFAGAFWMAAICVMGAAGTINAQEHLSLSAPSRTATLPTPFGAQKSFPVVSNGFVVSYSLEFTSAGAITAHDLQTAREISVPFSLPNASRTVVHDVSVTPDRQFLLVVGLFTPADGGADQPFIVKQALAGASQTVINVGEDFVPVRVCGGADGSTWTLGQTMAEVLHMDVSPLPEYDMVRSFAANGNVRHSLLARSSQGSNPLHLLPLGRAFGNRLGTSINPARLVCGDSSVGVFIGNPVFTWTEISLATGSLQTFNLKPIPQASITGLALLGENTAFASFVEHGSSLVTNQLFKLTLLPNHQAEWTPVADQGSTGSRFAVLLGRDGTSLVHLRGRRLPTNTQLFWSTP
jgi:hypothetical protein